MKKDDADIPFSKPYILTKSSIEKVCASLAEAIDCREDEIVVRFDQSKGYYFYGPYDICVADLLYEAGEYRGIQIYGGIIEDLKVQLEEERVRVAEDKRKAAREKKAKERRSRKRQFILQRYVIPGVAITIGGIAVLTSIGAIHNYVNKEQTSIVQQDQGINTVANANDLILYEWSMYAMNHLSDIANETEIDHIKSTVEYLRNEYFTPIMSSYYGYVEEGMLDLPIELTGESIKTNHNSFRNKVYLFDEAIQTKGFKDALFARSPFANAIVVDAYGKVVTGAESGLFGEVYDSKGELLTSDSEMGYSIYIRAEDVLDNDYGTSNYPDDAIMYKGVAYVHVSHLYDFQDPKLGSK